MNEKKVSRLRRARRSRMKMRELGATRLSVCIASGPGKSMQKLSASENCRSVSQLRSATISRYIRAICAAGPPNDKIPIFAQTCPQEDNDGDLSGDEGLACRAGPNQKFQR